MLLNAYIEDLNQYFNRKNSKRTKLEKFFIRKYNKKTK